MAIKLYDKADEVPEAIRATAIETKDGKFAVEEVDPALGDAGKKALDTMKAERNESDRLRKEAERERDELKRTAEARAKGISEEELQKIRDAEVAARKPIEDELAATKGALRKLKLTDRVQSLALKHGVMPDRIEDAMLLLASRTDLTDADGIAVKDREGNVTAETIDDFLNKSFRAEKPWLYAGTEAAGSGSRGSDGKPENDKPQPTKEALEERARQIAGAF